MTTDRDREAFEAWLFPQCSERTHPLWTERRGESYAHPVTRGSWEGWQAALAHAREAGAQEPMAERCEDCPPVGYPTDRTRCTPCDRRAPDDGTCVRCGAAPRNASGLCATCVDEDAVRAGEVEDAASQALWRQALDQERVPAAPVSPPAESGEVERLREALETIKAASVDGWFGKIAGDALASTPAPQPADHRRVQDAEIPPSALDQPSAWWAETGTAGAGEGCNKPFWLRHEAVAYVQKHGGYVAPLFRRYEAPPQDRMILMPTNATEEMLAATHDASGHMRLLEFTMPEERSKPFLIMRACYRAMVDHVRKGGA